MKYLEFMFLDKSHFWQGMLLLIVLGVFLLQVLDRFNHLIYLLRFPKKKAKADAKESANSPNEQ